MEPAPAEAVVRALFDHVRDVLEGNGTRVRRDPFRRTGDLRDVAAAGVRRTRA
ncbi:hypothetical protein ACFW3D_32960 [Streptomyces sp. NPDC058864]